MKRSYALETLSWEHHNGLVLSFRLERGIQLGAEIEEVKNYLLHVWQTALSIHFKEEEAYLTVKAEDDLWQEGFQKMYVEHHDFYQLIRDLESCEDHEKSRQLIHEFSEKLKSHIRFEEREFFPIIEKALTKQQILELGRKLHQLHKPVDLGWPVEFWKKEENE